MVMTLLKKLNQRAALVDKEFNVTYYRDSLESIMNRHFKKEWTSDSIEIGELNLEWTNNIPFPFIFDSMYNAGYSKYTMKDSSIKFVASYSYSNERPKKLQALTFIVYWKTQIAYPYKEIPF